MNRLLVTLMLVLVFAFSFAKLANAQTPPPAGSTPPTTSDDGTGAPAPDLRHRAHRSGPHDKPLSPPPATKDDSGALLPPGSTPPASASVTDPNATAQKPVPAASSAEKCDDSNYCYRQPYTVNGVTYNLDIKIADGKAVDKTKQADCGCDIADLPALVLPDNFKAGSADANAIWQKLVSQRQKDLEAVSAKQKAELDRKTHQLAILKKACIAGPGSEVVKDDNGGFKLQLVSYIKKDVKKPAAKKDDPFAELDVSTTDDNGEAVDPELAQQECRDEALKNTDDPDYNKVLSAIAKSSETDFLKLMNKASMNPNSMTADEMKRLDSLAQLHNSVLASGDEGLVKALADIDAAPFVNAAFGMKNQLTTFHKLEQCSAQATIATCNPSAVMKNLSSPAMAAQVASLNALQGIAATSLATLNQRFPDAAQDNSALGVRLSQAYTLSQRTDLDPSTGIKKEIAADTILSKQYAKLASSDSFYADGTSGSDAYKAASAQVDEIWRGIIRDANGNVTNHGALTSQTAEKYALNTFTSASLQAARPTFATSGVGSGFTSGLASTGMTTPSFNNAATSNWNTVGAANNGVNQSSGLFNTAVTNNARSFVTSSVSRPST